MGRKVIHNTTSMVKNPTQEIDANAPNISSLAWKQGLVFCLLTVIITISYLPTVITLHHRWVKFDQAYSHGYAVIVVLVYFLWSRKIELFVNWAKPQPLLLIPLVGSTLLALASQLSYTAVIGQLLLPVLLWIGFSSIYGINSGKQLLPYMILIYFAIPFWGELAPYLQSLTVIVCSFLLSLVEIPAYIYDSHIQIDKGTFHVASGCSGLSYFLVSLLTACIYSLEFKLSLIRTLQLLCLAALFGMISNWLRVTSLVVLGHLTDLSHPIIQDHVLHGWLISAVFMGLLFLIASRYIPHGRTDKQASNIADKLQKQAQSQHQQRIIFIAVVIIVVMPLYINGMVQLLSPSLIPTFARYKINSTVNTSDTYHFNGWAIKSTDKQGWQPKLQNADFAINQHWFNGYESVEVSITGYLNQIQGKELINSGNQLVDSSWQWESKNPGEVFSDGIIQSNSGEKYAVRYWFQLGEQAVSSEIRVKILSALANLTGVTNGAFILIRTRCSIDCKIATALLANEYSLIKKHIDRKVLGINFK